VVIGTAYLLLFCGFKSWGYGQFKNIVVLAATDPAAQMSPPIVVSSDGSMLVTWVAPSSNGSPITAYNFELLQADGLTYSKELADCSGSRSAVLQSR
jgi:hypothetical protein